MVCPSSVSILKYVPGNLAGSFIAFLRAWGTIWSVPSVFYSKYSPISFGLYQEKKIGDVLPGYSSVESTSSSLASCQLSRTLPSSLDTQHPTISRAFPGPQGQTRK